LMFLIRSLAVLLLPHLIEIFKMQICRKSGQELLWATNHG